MSKATNQPETPTPDWPSEEPRKRRTPAEIIAARDAELAQRKRNLAADTALAEALAGIASEREAVTAKYKAAMERFKDREIMARMSHRTALMPAATELPATEEA